METQEVRQILHDVLNGFQEAQRARDEAAAQRERLINISLNNIDRHLDRLNGKVAEHEKIININLPHSIENCPQNADIRDIRDNMISNKTIKRTIILTTTIGISILGILVALVEFVIKT